MSLRVWLPLNGDLRNQGLDGNVSVTNNGAIVNNSGKTGACYSFGTAKSYFKFDDVSFMHSFTECSITLWLKIISWNTSYATYFQFGLGSTPWSNYIFGLLRNNATSKLCFSIAKGSSSSQTSCSTPELQLNTWYHFSFIYTLGHCKIYINGVKTTDLSTTIVPNFAGITTGTIGACNNGSSYQTNCLLNDLRIYDHALSEKEVKEIAKGLILHYKLDEVPVEINNAYSAPYFDVDNQNGGWNHWGASGSSGSFARNHDKQYIFFKNKERNHVASNAATATGNYLVYQSPAFDGGFRSLQCIVKEKNSNPITEAIVYPAWNAHMDDGAASNKWTNVINLGDGFYLCQVDGIHQSGSNDLIGFYVKPGYTVYFSAAWCENDKEVCSDIFSDIDLIEDTSGYNYINTPVGTINVDKDTPRYDKAASFNGSSYLALGKQLYNARDEMTVNLWCKKDWTKNVGTPFSCVQTGGFGWQVNGANYTFYCGTGASSNTYISKALTVNNLSAGWHMLSATYDGLALRLYIDGELNSTVNKYSTKTLLFYNNNSGMFIGGESSGALMTTTTDRFKGSISDVRVYCTALSADDIKELYQTSVSIDDKQNFYSRELSNSLHDTTSITQAGITLADDFVEDTVAAIKDDRSIESNCFYEY